MRRVPIRLLATLSLTFALFAIGQTAHAATVTTAEDSGPGSLREALANAASGETITFDLSCTVCTIELTSGALVIDTDVTISGPGSQRLFIDANGLSRVFTMTPGVTAEIGGVSVTGGNSQMEDDHTGSGGGIWVQQGTLTLRNVVVKGNHADHGGGIFFDGTLTAIDGEISENTALSVGAGIHGLGMLTVTNSRFVGNHSRWGAGVYVERGTLSMTGSTLTDNDVSREGGALYILGSDQSTIIDTTLRGNRADSGSGGGVFSAGNVAIIKCTISGNVSGGVLGGGGLYSVGSLTVVDSTISGNSSEETGRGGGISIPSGSATIVNSTIVLNGEGGVRNQNATFVLSNTIVAGNTGFDVTGTIDTANNNLIGDVTGIDVSSIIELTLANNGGTTQTHALLANSPAIGAGSNSWLPTDELDLDGDGDTTEPLPVDQRGVGFPRVQGSNVDIGAVEVACSAITVTPPALPNGTVGGPYSQILSATGGQSPHTFSAASLPPGLTLTPQGVLSGTPTTAGTFTFAVMVVENGGCASTVEVTLTIAFPFSGFFAPVDNLPTVNTVNAGRAIPIKFSLGGNRGLNIFAAGYPQIQQMACDSGALQDPIEETVTAGNSSLSYHAGSDTYSYVWKTNKAWAGTCWQLNLRLTDGTDHRANFAFK